jgi:hypothetical protein
VIVVVGGAAPVDVVVAPDAVMDPDVVVALDPVAATAAVFTVDTVPGAALGAPAFEAAAPAPHAVTSTAAAIDASARPVTRHATVIV